MKRYLLAIDPGDSTGICVFDFDTGDVADMRIIKAEEFPAYLRKRKPEKYAAIVYEDFILFRGKEAGQVGSRFKASQVIGQLKMWGDDHSIRLVRQASSVLSNGYKASGMPRAGSHKDSHDKDAYVHGWVFLNSIGKV